VEQYGIGGDSTLTALIAQRIRCRLHRAVDATVALLDPGRGFHGMSKSSGP
jgi:hypothetical protein